MDEKQITRNRSLHAKVWKNDTLWVMPAFAFTSQQWEFMLECMETIRYMAQDHSITDSKCVEFIFAEFAAQYGIQMVENGVENGH